MKKTYVKPMVAFESFQMTSNVAGDCTAIGGNQSNGDSCEFSDTLTGVTIFTSTNTDCAPDDDNPYGVVHNSELCYHVPVDGAKMFNS